MDEETRQLEEQIGIPTIDLKFAEGRVVIPMDGRKVTRDLKALDAKLRALDSRARRLRYGSGRPQMP